MNKNQKRLSRIVQKFKGRTIGVFGDFMYDELLRGEATRISPEAPVPVVLMEHPHAGEGFAGGAGNVAANIGADEIGRRLQSLLKKRGIPCDALVSERGRITPRKVRIVAHQHQLLRMDFERPTIILSRTALLLGRHIERWMARLDALIISDYLKGSVTTELC